MLADPFASVHRKATELEPKPLCSPLKVHVQPHRQSYQTTEAAPITMMHLQMNCNDCNIKFKHIMNRLIAHLEQGYGETSDEKCVRETLLKNDGLNSYA